jgi:SAM-dependent methyltransferase
MAKKKKAKSKGSMARRADKYRLYTDSVQCPDSEIHFFRRVYRKYNKKSPQVMREDFCGTAAICCEWVRRGSKNRAIGVDLDPEPLAWCAEHYLPELTDKQRERLTFLQENVMDVREKADAILALNFSFGVFKQRADFLKYMQGCHESLDRNGIFVMDIYGGPEAQRPQQDETEKDGYTYIWDQNQYNPITNECVNHIHFVFSDGSRMRRAFTYEWRLWSLAELRDLMHEAGFREVVVYWEGTDDDGSGNGVFAPRESVEVEDAWVAYIVGVK